MEPYKEPLPAIGGLDQLALDAELFVCEKMAPADPSLSMHPQGACNALRRLKMLKDLPWDYNRPWTVEDIEILQGCLGVTLYMEAPPVPDVVDAAHAPQQLTGTMRVHLDEPMIAYALQEHLGGSEAQGKKGWLQAVGVAGEPRKTELVVYTKKRRHPKVPTEFQGLPVRVEFIGKVRPA